MNPMLSLPIDEALPRLMTALEDQTRAAAERMSKCLGEKPGETVGLRDMGIPVMNGPRDPSTIRRLLVKV